MILHTAIFWAADGVGAEDVGVHFLSQSSAGKKSKNKKKKKNF
jgi:hypothetical protein